MVMTPLTPLGKALTESPLPSSQTPVSKFGQPVPAMDEQPISVFQWVSLARATWTWLLRPLWYFCFKWPTNLVRYMLAQAPESDGDRRRREAQEYDGWKRNPANPFRNHP